jgi:hypothetical protein
MNFYDCVALHLKNKKNANVVHFELLHEFARLCGPPMQVDHPVIVAWLKEAQIKSEEWAMTHEDKVMQLAEGFYDYHAEKLTRVMSRKILALLAAEVYDCQIGFKNGGTLLSIDWFCPTNNNHYFCDINDEAPTFVLTPVPKSGLFTCIAMHSSSSPHLLLVSECRFVLRMTRAGMNKKVAEFHYVSEENVYEVTVPPCADCATTYQVYPGDPKMSFYDFKVSECLVLTDHETGKEIGRTFSPEVYLYFKVQKGDQPKRVRLRIEPIK